MFQPKSILYILLQIKSQFWALGYKIILWQIDKQLLLDLAIDDWVQRCI